MESKGVGGVERGGEIRLYREIIEKLESRI